MIGGISCALAGMPPKYIEVVREVAHCLNSDNPEFYRDKIFRVTRQLVPANNPREYKFLRPVARAVAEVFNPLDFYNDKNDEIWFLAEFAERILSVAEPFQPTENISSPFGFDIVEPANDSDIRWEFPANHFYSASEFCWQAKRMVQAQSNGASGPLLNNGFASIFYVIGKGGEVFSVHVHWYAAYRLWNFYCYSLGEIRWCRGHRAFSRN